MHILVTGAASYLARTLLPRLCEDPRVARVTGTDSRPVAFRHAKFTHQTMDLRDPALAALLRGPDALVHLAYVVLRGRMPADEMAAINVAATKRLVANAVAAGVGRTVHLSSAAVYGNGENLSESARLAPLPRFLYARHKAELEDWLKRHQPGVVSLRPHIILGPNAQPLLKRLLRQPWYVRLPDPQPRLQCVHEQDVSAAIVQALFAPAAAGPYNLAAADAFSVRDTILARHPHAVGVPLTALRMLLEVSWRTLGAGGEPGWLDGVGRPLTLNCERAARDLDWAPAYTSRQAIALASPGPGG